MSRNPSPEGRGGLPYASLEPEILVEELPVPHFGDASDGDELRRLGTKRKNERGCGVRIRGARERREVERREIRLLPDLERADAACEPECARTAECRELECARRRERSRARMRATRCASTAARDSSSKCIRLFDAMESEPSPTAIPASSISMTGAMPWPSFALEIGQCATVLPVAAMAAMSESLTRTQ